MKKFVSLFVVLGILVLTLAACKQNGGTGLGEAVPSGDAGTSGAPSYTLRFGHALTEQDTFHQYMEEWAEAVYKATEGGLLIEVYPNAQLGNEEDVIEQVRQGANIGWQTDFARLGNYVNELSVVNAPYFVSNLNEAFSLTGSATIQELNERLAQEYGILNFSYSWVQGDRHVFTNTAVHNPSEMSALSIRTASAPIWIESVNSVGCTAVALPYSEIYTGIQTKVVDGCELPYNAALNSKLQEVCSYVIETGHIFQLNSMIISADWYGTLPEEYQRILVEECNMAGEKASAKLAEQTDASRAEMVSEGIHVIGQDELDMDAFIAKSSEAYEKLGLSEVRASVYADIGK